MKKSFLTLAVVSLLSTATLATVAIPSGSPSASSSSSSNAIGGAGGQGGYATGGNQAQGQLQGQALNNSNTSTSNSGSNTLSNGQGQDQGQGQTASTSGNTTTVNGSTTTVQRSAPGLGGQISVQQVGTTGFNVGATSIFGGMQIGFNKTNKDAKALMRAQTEELFQRSNSQYVQNVKETCTFVSEEDCQALKDKLVNDLLND
jgi:hypothetical protein